MGPGRLTDVEEILIGKVFPVISVYTLPGGQYAYRGNIINFPQDAQEFAARLLHDPIIVGFTYCSASFGQVFIIFVLIFIVRFFFRTISSIIRELWKFSAIEPFSGKVCNIHHQYRYHDRIYCLPSANEELALLFPDEQENPKNLDPSSEHNEVSPVEEFHTPGYSPTFILGGSWTLMNPG
ncbi:hypothetical protein RirG_084290 [Rhizophagus irregularis DAOM 197198w]|uniref:DUF6570 domain-containing protein n=1 Tax=Rhizophagus irregularis (strain DAOM 197198w) TaxID=1432141 RepID=A0A015JMQ9_RHIIW|nr:hypothetical protein RirG_084290 [Rhizophagus irregularis DAOM 197198w]